MIYYNLGDTDMNTKMQEVVGRLQTMPPIPVGVDTGAHSVKALSPYLNGKPISFRSVYTTTATPPVLNDVLGGRIKHTDPMLYDENGLYTLFGTTAMNHTRASKLVSIDPNERASSGTTKTFFVGALCKLLPAGDHHVVAVLGLPVSDIDPNTVKKMQDKFVGYYEFSSPDPEHVGETLKWRVLVSKVAIIEQPRGSVYSFMFDDNGNPLSDYQLYTQQVVAVIDHGGRTLDWVYLQPMETVDGARIPVVVPEFSGSTYAGTQMVEDILRNDGRLAQYANNIRPFEWDRIIRVGEFVNNATGERVDLKRARDRAYAVVAARASEVLRESLGGERGSTSIARVVLTGGSAHIIADAVRNLYGAHRVVGPNKDSWATNVRGFYRLASFYTQRMVANNRE
jgi:hypothetical protein